MRLRKQWKRGRIHFLSRFVILTVVLCAIGTLLWEPSGAFTYTIDIIFRTHLMFLCTVMAHEGIHGNLGKSAAANLWWSRIALVPTMVPFTNFRKTHLLHHAFANIPDRDPDYFVRPSNSFEIPLRAVAMPHYWVFWLHQRGRINRRHVLDLSLNYAAILMVYGTLLTVVDPGRLLLGVIPPLILVSILLWYTFAVKTHEGFSTGSADSRSHNYYGAFMFWFSLGLSMHRTHHARPKLAWIELRDFVEKDEETAFSFIPRRDIHF